VQPRQATIIVIEKPHSGVDGVFWIGEKAVGDFLLDDCLGTGGKRIGMASTPPR
jgi:hypothetical protein